jgi:hypothetical protein
MSSADSSVSDKDVLRAIDKGFGALQLEHLSIVDSIDRNLENEDRMAKQHEENCEAVLWGTEMKESPGPEEDNMRILAARDVIVNQHTNHELEPSQPAPPQPAPHPPFIDRGTLLFILLLLLLILLGSLLWYFWSTPQVYNVEKWIPPA